MKKIIYLFSISFVLIFPSLNAQWKSQVRLKPYPNTASISISAVDSNIVWALSVDLNQFSDDGDPIGPMNRFTRSTNGGISWKQDTISGAKGLHPGSITAIDSMTAWVAMQDESLKTSGGIFKTTDGGKIWTKQSSAFTGAGTKPVFIYFYDADTGIIVGDSKADKFVIYTTTNGGAQWDSVPRVNIPPKQAGEKLREGFEFSAFHNSFWFCTSGPAGRIFRSSNRGHDWTVALAGTKFDRVHSIAFQDDSTGLAAAFIGDSSTMIRSTNGGKTWFPVATPFTPTPHLTSYVPGTPGSYVVVGHVGTVTGSAFTLDGGYHWTTIDAVSYGLITFITPTVGWVVGGPSWGNNYIYRWSGPALIPSPDHVSTIGVPAEIRLDQNYPNPFNSSTIISYRVPAAENVTIKVYDMLGKEVSTLVNEKKPAGSYTVEFESKGLPVGIYFYKLREGKNAEIKKMTVL